MTQVVLKSVLGLLALASIKSSISSTRPLPTYCYFPFDLTKPEHRKYLDQLTRSGELSFNLLVGKKSVKRVHHPTPYVQALSAENLAKASREMPERESPYDFNAVLLSMERHIRIPSLLNRLLLEDTFGEVLENVAEAVKLVPDERKLLARRGVDEIAADFLPFYEKNQDQYLETVRRLAMGLALVMELRRLFFGDPDGFAKFLADMFAACLSDQELIGFRDLIKVIISFSKLPASDHSVPVESNSRVPTASTALLNSVLGMVRSGISKDGATRFLELLGLEVGGTPGPIAVDYSREYNLKASGLSWTEVATKMLQEDAALIAEFGGREFVSLTFQQRENLKNRIRERARSCAERTGKPFPIERSPAIMSDPQKNQ
jgi:hypothetical protein